MGFELLLLLVLLSESVSEKFQVPNRKLLRRQIRQRERLAESKDTLEYFRNRASRFLGKVSGAAVEGGKFAER